MKISPNYQILKFSDLQKVQNNRITPFRSNNISGDTYVSTTPSFRGGMQDAAKEILNNPKHLAGFGAFMAAAYSALKALADGEINKHADIICDSPENLTEKYVQNYADKNIEDEELEIIQATEPENNEPDNISEDEIRIIGEDAVEKETNIVKVSYPKKIGRLKAHESNLKAFVEILSLPQNHAEKLEKLCLDIRSKKSFNVNGETLNNAEFTQKFVENMSAALTNETPLEEVIDEFSLYVSTPETNEENEPQDISEESVTENNETTGQKSEPQIFDSPESRKLPGVKQVGFVDLNTINYGSRKKTTLSEQQTEDVSKESEIVEPTELEDESDSYIIRIPGTLSNVQNGFSSLFNKFIEKTKKANPQNPSPYILRRACVVRATKEDILNELVKRKRINHGYVNINTNNAEEIADVLSTGMFKNLFSLHSAMRFIDRFVDFNSNKSIEEQCEILIPALENAIKQTFIKGCKFQIFEKMQKKKLQDGTFENKIAYAPTMLIEPENLSSDIQKILGTIPIRITFSKVHNGQHNHNGIICTLFPCGVQYDISDMGKDI